MPGPYPKDGERWETSRRVERKGYVPPPLSDKAFPKVEAKEVVNESDSWTKEQLTSSTVHDRSRAREQDPAPSRQSPRKSSEADIDSRERSYTPSPRAPKEQSGQVVSPRNQDARLYGPSRQLATDPTSDQQPSLGASTAHQLLAKFLDSRENFVTEVIDMSTKEGQHRFTQFMQDFFRWLADRGESDRGVVQRGGLGLDMGNMMSVPFPGLTGFTTLVFSQRATTIPRREEKPLGSLFSVGDLFWTRTNEWAADSYQKPGDKCAPTNYGLIITGWRLNLVVATHPDSIYTTWGRCHTFRGMEKTPEDQRWRYGRALDHRQTDDVPPSASPHNDLLVTAGGWDRAPVIDSTCYFNLLEANPLDTLAWEWYYAGRLSDNARDMVDWLRRAYVNQTVDISPVPNGINVDAVRRGLRKVATPIEAPRESVYGRAKHNPLHKFPRWQDLVAPYLAPAWGSVNRHFKGNVQDRRGHGYVPHDRGRGARRDGNGGARDRGRSRSRSPRREEDRGRAPCRDRRDRRDHHPGSYDGAMSRRRQSPLRQQAPPDGVRDLINRPTINAREMGEANAVFYDDHDGNRQFGYYGNGQPHQRDPERGDYGRSNRGCGGGGRDDGNQRGGGRLY